jgi:hypothetical protein
MTPSGKNSVHGNKLVKWKIRRCDADYRTKFLILASEFNEKKGEILDG